MKAVLDYWGDPNNPDPLDPELAAAMTKGTFGESIKHPLVYSIGHWPQMNRMVNRQLAAKKEAVAKALAEQRWSSYLWLHERPYRLNAFMDIMNKVSDNEYWDLLASIWVDSENLAQWGPAKRLLLGSERPGRENMMEEEEREALAKLPERFTIYRGFSSDRMHPKAGWSWTLSISKAKWFARRYKRPRNRSGLATGIAIKKDVIALFLGRGEDEVVINPRKVRDISTLPVEEEDE